MNQKIVVSAVALIVGLGVGYFIPHGAAAKQNGQFAGARRAAPSGAFGGGGGMGFLAGTVAQMGEGSLTLNTRDGSSHVVLLTPQTTVSKSVTGSLADVAVGSTIIVSGTTGSDGSVTAALVQLRPASTTVPYGR